MLCLLGLRVLEVVRLVVADMGVGLLPVAIIANVINIMMLTLECSSCEMGRARSLSISAVSFASYLLDAAKMKHEAYRDGIPRAL